jgi:hypothetical protein
MPDKPASSGTERDTPNTEDGQEKVEPKKRKAERQKPQKKERIEAKGQETASGKSREKGREKREIKVAPKVTNEAKPTKESVYGEVAAKIQEVRSAPNDSKSVDFTYKDRLNFIKVCENAGLDTEAIAMLDMAQLIDLTEEAINGRVKGATVTVLPPENGETQSPLEKLTAEKAADSGEEDLTVEAIHSRLKPGKGGRLEIGGAGVIVDMPNPRDIADPVLRAFVDDIDSVTGRRGEESLLSQLGEIENELRRAITDGRLSGANVDQIREVRTKLTEFLDERHEAYIASERAIRAADTEREKLYRKSRGDYNFDDNFSPVLKAAKDDLAVLAGGDNAEAASRFGDLLRSIRDQVAVVSTGGVIEYRTVFEVSRAVNQAIGNYSIDTVREIFTKAVGATDAQEFLSGFISADSNINYQQRLDRYFRIEYYKLTKEEREVVAGDIDRNAGLAIGSITAGWAEQEQRINQLFQIVDDPRKLAEMTSELKKGIRQWKGLSGIHGVEVNIINDQIFKPPPDWHDTPQVISKVITTLRAQGLSVQDMQTSLNQTFEMLRRMQRDIPEGRLMFDVLRRRLEAFKFEQSEIITAHEAAMDPEHLEKVYNQITEGTKEETFEDMISRHGEDPAGHVFYSMEHGRLEKVNLFEVENDLLSDEYLRDYRIRANMVEEMTKYSINGSLSADVLGLIKTRVDFDYLPEEWKQRISDDMEFNRTGLSVAWRGKSKWEVELEVLRIYLKEKMRAAIVKKVTSRDHDKGWYVGKSVEDVWGREKDLGGSSLTKSAIDHWYTKRTLHGASGLLEEHDADEVLGDLLDRGVYTIRMGETPAQALQRLKYEHVGRALLDIRREELRFFFKKKLSKLGLSYDPDFYRRGSPAAGDLIKSDLEDLDMSGFLASVDSSVFDNAWVFQWSTYNVLHIYGRGESKYDDDYKAVIFCPQSDQYGTLSVDHSGEFLSPDFENRGRSKAGEVNQVFQQFFPGKHHWLFPHVAMTVRFGREFLSDEPTINVNGEMISQKEILRRKTDALIKKHHFTSPDPNYSDEFRNWMEGAALREMFVNGSVIMGRGKGGGKKYTEVVEEKKTFTKFNLVDNQADRKLIGKNFMGPNAYQAYLADPTVEKLMEITAKDKLFASTRNARLFPFFEFVLPAHWKVVHTLRHKLFDKPDITNNQMENLVDLLKSSGYILKGQGDRFKRKELGITKGPRILGTRPFRVLRAMILDEEKRTSQVEGPLLWRLFVMLFWHLPFGAVKTLGKVSLDEAKKQ